MDEQLDQPVTPPNPQMVGTPLSDLLRRAAKRMTADTPDSQNVDGTWTNLFNGSYRVPELFHRTAKTLSGNGEQGRPIPEAFRTLNGIGRDAARWTYGGLTPGGLTSNPEIDR
jgi:hypothetical protein